MRGRETLSSKPERGGKHFALTFEGINGTYSVTSMREAAEAGHGW